METTNGTPVTFVRENRYLVLRWSDIFTYLWGEEVQLLREMCTDIEQGRMQDGKDPRPKFVCIKDTYPEYEMVWAAIEKRMTSG